MRTILTITAACLLLGACGEPTPSPYTPARQITPEIQRFCDAGRAIYTYNGRIKTIIVDAPECAPLKPSVAP